VQTTLWGNPVPGSLKPTIEFSVWLPIIYSLASWSAILISSRTTRYAQQTKASDSCTLVALMQGLTQGRWNSEITITPSVLKAGFASPSCYTLRWLAASLEKHSYSAEVPFFLAAPA